MPGEPSIDNMWSTYAEQVLPEDAGPIQTQVTKRAFYGGAVAIHNIFIQVGELPEDEALKVLARLGDEFDAFVAKVSKGSA